MRMRHFLIVFAFLSSLSGTLKAQCPTLANTVFTPTDVSCYGFDDGVLNVVFNDGVPPYTIALAYDEYAERK